MTIIYSILKDKSFDEAIETPEIKSHLQAASGYDPAKYENIVKALRAGFAKEKVDLAEVAPDEHSRCTESGRRIHEYMLNTHTGYQHAVELEEEALSEARNYQSEVFEYREKLDRVRESPSPSPPPYDPGPPRRRKPFGGIFSKADTPRNQEQRMQYKYQQMLEQMQRLRRQVADAATDRLRIELIAKSNKNTPAQLQSLFEEEDHAKAALHATLLERAIVPYLQRSIQEYIPPLQPEKDLAQVLPSSTPKGDDQVAIDASVDKAPVSQLESASLAVAANASGPGDKRTVFLVHGRDKVAAQAMREFLRSLHLRVLEWEHAVEATGHTSPYVGDVVLAGMRMADAIVVLSSPDDVVCLRPDLISDDDQDDPTPRGQARANVIYEAGIADALAPRRTVLVEVGTVKSFSDIGGRNVVRFDGSARSRNRLAARLRHANLAPNTTGDDWLTSGDFERAIDTARMAYATQIAGRQSDSAG